ncbi:hypothetical protein F5Y04DRAFT_262500 [Hypomontagnella monticulosa]|nr:hypothetical protein F5Y04DRAFT_262500 [Hypomontagnella monticulosa]
MDFRSFRRGGLADADIKHAKAALKRVIEELNSLDFRLKFEYVRQKDQRDFTLAYDAPDEIRPDPNFFAYAFFPDARQNERKIKMNWG